MSPGAVVHRPDTREGVLELLADHGESATLVAGGTAFTILKKAGFLRPDHVISLLDAPGMRDVSVGDSAVSIGALVRIRDIERSAELRRHHPVLTGVAGLVANARVRNVATIGGNVSEADPTSDPPAVLAALDAVVHVAHRDHERAVPAQEFFLDYFETSLAPDEVVTNVYVPTLPTGWGGSYLKFLSRSAEDRTCLGVAAFVCTDSDRTCRGLRVAVVGAGPVPLRLPEVERQAVGRRLETDSVEAVTTELVDASDPLSDLRGSAEYRKQVMASLIPRAIERAIGHENDAVIA